MSQVTNAQGAPYGAPDYAGQIERDCNGVTYKGVYVHEAAALGRPLQIICSDATYAYATQDAADSGARNDEIGVVVGEAITGAGLAWLALDGDVPALVDGDSVDVVAQDGLKLAAGGTAFVKDATATTDLAAYAKEANDGAAALKTVTLRGIPCQIS